MNICIQKEDYYHKTKKRIQILIKLRRLKMPFPKCNLNYFIEEEANIIENSELREPQIDAYMAAYEHFVVKRKMSHAIIVLPTGVGKTGLMGLLPYGISKGRVLIITPQLTIKDTVSSELNPDSAENFYIKRKVFTDPKRLPVIIEYDKDTTNEILEAANIVILNVHKLQERLDSSLLKQVPNDFFDMIIIDEAHHSVAKTWTEAVHYFSNSKVVKLTGTPLRSDNKQIFGELIYHYSLAQAMARNYVKSLSNLDYIPGDAYFTIDKNSEKLLSYDEIKEIKDDDWVSRSVALSDTCSREIVKESIKIVNRKIEEGNGVQHKIIAVACNIEHAKKIKSMYEDEGCTATIIHSKMSTAEIEEAKSDIENHRVKAVVEVAMLGEGYDHKYLSVAAIFRPFRSQLPYQQFIGRILRYIPEGNAEDNVGEIISHSYLNLQDLWKEYKKEIEESEIIKSLSGIELVYEKHFHDEYSIADSKEYGNVIEKGNYKIIEDSYMKTELMKQRKKDEEERNRKIEVLKKELNLSYDQARNILINSETQNNPIKRPDYYYSDKRKSIDIKIKEEIVPDILTDYDIDKNSDSLKSLRIFNSRDYNWITKKNLNNAGLLATYFNSYLKKEIGKNRKEWTIDDYEIAKIKLEMCVEYLKNLFKN